MPLHAALMAFIYARSTLISELVIHHQAPLAFLILMEPKHFHGPEKPRHGKALYSHVSTSHTESDYFRGIGLKLLKSSGEDKKYESVKGHGKWSKAHSPSGPVQI